MISIINEEMNLKKEITIVPNKSVKIDFQREEPEYFCCSLFGVIFPGYISVSSHEAAGEIFISYGLRRPNNNKCDERLKIGKTRFEKPKDIVKPQNIFFTIYPYRSFTSFVTINFLSYNPEGIFDDQAHREKVKKQGADVFEIDYAKFKKYFKTALKKQR